jgi:Protein of unknown function (DUF1616)
MKGHHDLRLVVSASLLCAVVALLVPLEAVRLLFAAPLALLLPGYAIAAATFARRSFEWPQFMLYSVALSLCALATGAVVLNFVPGGIRALSWAALLLLVVAGGCLVAARRRPAARPAASPSWPRPGLPDTAFLLGGLLAVVAALVLAATTFPAKDAVGDTQLWVVPRTGSGSTGVEVGVGNQEQTAIPFDLLIRIGDRPIVRRSFTLDPGQTRIVRLAAGPRTVGKRVPVVATLLRQNRPYTIDLRVNSWLLSRGATE